VADSTHVPERTIVATGSWLYDGTLPKPVYIVRLNWDHWFEIGKIDGTLEPWERPRVDVDGCAYYVSFHGIHPDGSFWPDSIGHDSIAGAKANAEERCPSPIEWE
jgi:hypothetical protein